LLEVNHPDGLILLITKFNRNLSGKFWIWFEVWFNVIILLVLIKFNEKSWCRTTSFCSMNTKPIKELSHCFGMSHIANEFRMLVVLIFRRAELVLTFIIRLEIGILFSDHILWQVTHMFNMGIFLNNLDQFVKLVKELKGT